MKKIFTYSFALLFSAISLGQITYLTESQIRYEILHWHYDQYNHAETVEWYKTTVDGAEYFTVIFNWEGQQLRAIYDSGGDIVREIKPLDEKELAEPVIDVLDYRIVKYKVREYVRTTFYEKRKPVKTLYKVDARTKTGGQVVLWFDKEYNVIPDQEDRIASAN